MNLEETRNALAEWFAKRYIEEVPTLEKQEWVYLEEYVLGYIECGGILDNDPFRLALLKFKETQESIGMSLDNYGIRDYLNGHGEIKEKNMNIRQALEFNNSLTLNELRLMIARRFTAFITSENTTFVEKSRYINGFLTCGGTIEDLAKSDDITDKQLAQELLTVIGVFPTDMSYDFLKYLSLNSIKRGLKDRQK